jgi:hypothetical protein
MDYVNTHIKQGTDIADTAHTAALKVNQSSRIIKAVDDFVEDTPLPRVPTAGTPDSKEAKQRKKILAIQAKHLYVIQAALLTILLCVFAFLIMPIWAANMSVVLILATGIAAAIYLSQIQ